MSTITHDINFVHPDPDIFAHAQIVYHHWHWQVRLISTAMADKPRSAPKFRPPVPRSESSNYGSEHDTSSSSKLPAVWSKCRDAQAFAAGSHTD